MLFKGDMVCGVLDDTKTETRRLVTTNNSLIDGCGGGVHGLKKKDIFALPEFLRDSFVDPGPSPARNKGPYLKCPINQTDTVHRVYPMVQVGDRIWVKETFWGAHESEWDEAAGSSIDHGSDLSLGKEFHSGVDYVATPNALNPPKLEYQQSVKKPDEANVPGHWWLAPPDDWDGNNEEDREKRGEWIFLPWDLYTKHSSMFMPRWASRILLEVTAVWPERIQEINDEGAIAEGIKKYGDENCYKIYTPTTSFGTSSPVKSYESLWDSINAKNGHPWEQNDLVWVYQFKRVTN